MTKLHVPDNLGQYTMGRVVAMKPRPDWRYPELFYQPPEHRKYGHLIGFEVNCTDDLNIRVQWAMPYTLPGTNVGAIPEVSAVHPANLILL